MAGEGWISNQDIRHKTCPGLGSPLAERHRPGKHLGLCPEVGPSDVEWRGSVPVLEWRQLGSVEGRAWGHLNPATVSLEGLWEVGFLICTKGH
jgi:hypothetical protein